MTIEERIQKKEYLYKVKDSELIYGRQYNLNAIKFYDYAFFTVFPMLFREYIKENKDKVIEVKQGEDSIVYVDIDARREYEIMDYIRAELHDFFILRAIKDKDK